MSLGYPYQWQSTELTLDGIVDGFRAVGMDLNIDALSRKLRPGLRVEDFLALDLDMVRKHPACPWGDLTRGDGLRDLCGDGTFIDLPMVPVVLDVGSNGCFYQNIVSAGLLKAEKIGCVITSDIQYGNDLRIDVTDLQDFNLGGVLVDAITSTGVFTGDLLGAQFRSVEHLLDSIRAMHALLKPRGVMAHDLIGNQRFVSVAENSGLFVVVPELTRPGSVVMQKVL